MYSSTSRVLPRRAARSIQFKRYHSPTSAHFRYPVNACAFSAKVRPFISGGASPHRILARLVRGAMGPGMDSDVAHA